MTELEESEGLYRSLFQNNHSIMLIIDPASGDIRAKRYSPSAPKLAIDFPCLTI